MKKITAVLVLMLFFGQLQAQQAQDTTKVAERSEGRDSLTVAKMWGISLVAPSFSQIYNKQYWKAPVVLGGIGGTLFGGFRSHSLFKDTKKKYDNLLASGSPDAGMLNSLHSDYRRYQRNRNLFFVGTGLVYLWSLADGVYNYRFNTGEHSPSKATIYSTIFPGLGQIYNKKYWKLPLVYGGFAAFSYFIQSNSFRYNLYGDAYNVKSRLDKLPETGFEEERAALESQIPNVLKNLQADRLKYYRDAYRRDRDFFIILTVLFYGIQIIDAAVDAHFYTYDISNDLSFKFTPFVDQAAYGSVCGGVNLSFRF